MVWMVGSMMGDLITFHAGQGCNHGLNTYLYCSVLVIPRALKKSSTMYHNYTFIPQFLQALHLFHSSWWLHLQIDQEIWCHELPWTAMNWHELTCFKLSPLTFPADFCFPAHSTAPGRRMQDPPLGWNDVMQNSSSLPWKGRCAWIQKKETVIKILKYRGMPWKDTICK